MEFDTQAKLIVAAAGVAVTAAAVGITHHIRKHRTCKPLPGTTKVVRLTNVKVVKD